MTIYPFVQIGSLKTNVTKAFINDTVVKTDKICSSSLGKNAKSNYNKAAVGEE